MLNDLPVVRQSAAHTLVDVANVYRDQGRLDKAEKMWRRAATLDAKNLACRVELALRCERTNREREALQMCEQLRDLEPGNADHWHPTHTLDVLARLGPRLARSKSRFFFSVAARELLTQSLGLLH